MVFLALGESKFPPIGMSSSRKDTSLKSFEAATLPQAEAKFANDTVGLVPHAAFVNSRAKAVEHTAKLQQQEKQQKKESLDRQRINDKRRREALLKKRQAKLTFGSDDEEDDDDDDDTTRAAPPPAEKRQRLGFCPGVETSFLPDRDREADEAALREQLKQEYALETEDTAAMTDERATGQLKSYWVVYRSEDKGVVPWGSRLEHKAGLPDQLPFHIHHNGRFCVLQCARTQEDVEACGRATESVLPCAHTCTRMVGSDVNNFAKELPQHVTRRRSPHA